MSTRTETLAGPSASSEDERAPTSPPDVSTGGWKAVLRRSRQKSKADRVPMMAGSIAYHSLLSLFPAVIALIGITQLVGISSSFTTTLVHGIGKALPQGASTVLSDALEAAHHRTGGALTATVLAVVIALWSASSGMAVLQTGLDVAYEVPDRTFVANRLRALLLLVVVGVLGGIAAVLIVFASPLGHAIQLHIGLSESVFRIGWTVVRWVATIGVLLVLMAAVYKLGPNRRTPGWQWLSVGGTFATVVWLLASLALSYYVSSFGGYSKTYGALAGVVVLMLWMYITAYVVLFGAQLNGELERQVAVEGGHTGSEPPPPTSGSAAVEPAATPDV